MRDRRVDRKAAVVVAVAALAGKAAAWPDYVYSGAPVAIPDGLGTGTAGAPAMVSVTVPGAMTIARVECRVFVPHSFQGDLRLTLTHVESGVSAVLVDRPYVPQTPLGFPAPDYGSAQAMLHLADSAAAVYDAPTVAAPGITGVNGPWKPETPLSVFNGRNAQGTWRLTAVDFAAGDTGSIAGFTLTITPTANCYANCDGSTGTPVLTAGDFQCFLNRFTTGDPWANCDGSVMAPVLNVMDFQCYLNRFAVGCTAP
ncbi:MAG: hypothetical protein KF678_13690 [Phycisphaeraceae bacterium]|nr:hypothetical protein [Phycisphaeraceae bacterium]